MKTIFNEDNLLELIERINSLQIDSKNQWGKMNVYQMLKHCTLNEEMFQRKQTYKRLFMGRIFGSLVLKSILKNDAPMKKNQPTHPSLVIIESGNFENQRIKWIELLKSYDAYSNDSFVHPFFGKMTPKQVGNFVYKHTDHHLRQFGN